MNISKVSSSQISDLEKTQNQPYQGHTQFDCMIKDKENQKHPGIILFRNNDGNAIFAATSKPTRDVRVDAPTPTSPRLKEKFELLK